MTVSAIMAATMAATMAAITLQALETELPCTEM